jgi:hypothetical protein
MSQYLLPLTSGQKQKVAELLTLVFNDNEFLENADKVSGRTVEETELVMNSLIFCTRAITALFSAIRCVPKSPNVYGWLVGCLPGLVDVAKTHSSTLYSNTLCRNAIMTHRDSVKATML